MVEHRIFSITGPDAELEGALRGVGLDPTFVQDGEPFDACFADCAEREVPELFAMVREQRPPTVYLRLDRMGVLRALDRFLDLGYRTMWAPFQGGRYVLVAWIPGPAGGSH